MKPTSRSLTRLLSLFTLAFVLPFSFTACDSNNNDPEEYLEVDDNGNTRFNQERLADVIDALPKEELSDDELAGIIFMREEEKLAHDVYKKLYESWNRQVFDNISESELTHTEAVLVLIDKYDLADPAAGKSVGEFANQDLQTLYNTLITSGEVSAIEALKVGGAVEEIDIQDLEVQLDQNDNQDITMIYENLLKGSRNHLRAFVRNMSQLGETYTPQYLTQEAYDSIINSPMERGSSM